MRNVIAGRVIKATFDLTVTYLKLGKSLAASVRTSDHEVHRIALSD